MNMLVALLVVAGVVGLCVYALRRGLKSGGYRRRFENAYRHDDSATTSIPAVMFVAGVGDSGAHHQGASGHDCGVSSDAGSVGGCDGGST